MQCWNESPSTRPTAQNLLRCLQDVSPAWAPPLEYPIPDSPDREAAHHSISRSKWMVGTDALPGGFFVLSIVMLYIFMLSSN